MLSSSFNQACATQELSCDLFFENLVLGEGYRRVAGLDEVGRGALFGPVCAAAVILDLHKVPPGINDSKKLSPKQREVLAENIKEAALDYSIAFVDASVIDEINILQATIRAMQQSIRRFREAPDFLLCDAIVLTGCQIPQKAIVKGDALSISIAAASILAKVERDKLVVQLDANYPGYDLINNKGYGTAKHLDALSKLGPTNLHRMTFKGVRC